MKKTKLFFGILIIVISAFMQSFTGKDSKSHEIVRDKEAIDCYSYYGTRCHGFGDGCTPYSCNDISENNNN